MNIFDAVGLAAFTVTGIDTAVLAGYGDYHFLSVFLGVLTGVGGGVLRDIMAGQTPYILRKHVYASASIAGGHDYRYHQLWHDGPDDSQQLPEDSDGRPDHHLGCHRPFCCQGKELNRRTRL